MSARLFGVVWFGVLGIAWIAALVAGIGNLIAERWPADRGAWAAFGIVSGFVALGAALAAAGTWLGRSDEEFLRSWVAERLAKPEP